MGSPGCFHRLVCRGGEHTAAVVDVVLDDLIAVVALCRYQKQRPRGEGRVVALAQ